MKKRNIWIWLFASYCLLMFWLLFNRPGFDPAQPYQDQLRFNLKPLSTIRHFLRLLDSNNGGLRRHAFVNLVGNVIMFTPLGIFLPKLWPALRKFGRFLLTVVLAIVAVELIQLVALVGTCDVDDLLLNVFGAAVGFALFRMFDGKGKTEEI